MPIINIRENKFIFPIFISLWVFVGCQRESFLNKADKYSNLAELYYKKAVQEYEELIRKDKADSNIYLKLGKLYFQHGDFLSAIEVLKKSNSIESKKYLAISYYKTNDYTQALKMFDSLGMLEDDFYLYYYGLTCEALNLYNQAKEIYLKIKDPYYQRSAQQNLEKIEQIFKEDTFLEDARIKDFFTERFSREFYPEAGILFLLVDEEIEILKDNTSIYSGHFIIKILDERGKENFSEIVINYDSTYEKPYLEFARTIKYDGTSIFVGKKHIRDVSRYLNFPLYSNARALILSMPEVGVGCIVEYKFKIFKHQLIDKRHISSGYFVQESEPIVEAKFSVVLPSERRLNIKILNERYNQFNASLQPQIEEEDRIRYLWSFKDIPQIIAEPYMPAEVEINPVVMVSTIDSWQEVYNWWWNLTKDKIHPNSAIRETVQQLVRDVRTEEDKARAIYNFCARNIRYVAVAYGQAGYEPHSAEEIFLNKYGDCKDQSVLLVTMLKEAGLKAYPVLIGTRDYFNLYPDFPSVLFNHCIVLVELKDRFVFLDPTCSTCSFGDLPLDDQGRKVLVFKDDGFQIMDTFLSDIQHNRILHNFKINLSKDGLVEAEKEIIPWGVYNQIQRSWFLYSQPEMIRQKIEESIQNLSVGARLDSYSIENLEDLNEPVILKYNFQGPFYWIVGGNLRILPGLVDLATDLVAKHNRIYPLDLGFLSSEEMNLVIRLPKGLIIKYLPEGLKVDSPWFEFSVEYIFKEGNIYFRQKKIFKKRVITSEEYSYFKEFYQDILKKTNQRVVLEKTER